ncbi:Rhodanese-like protein [Dichomitus squalens]|uniref:Rhodanese-like protein n=1 Tax=Dichomitus squalens TaxID=114155 RepID=A0A4Q9N4Z6_9APHY|nr:Rhodanese-like protein [Dichomitus squalens LYAD-421 SS1]EJF66513.1 Rhodanese-like protein [Dichomitus squalens LYAD-421 SS1]TBU35038.1 Rhodanese-like protein [Dichomitus squalens]TBU49730.1 Rhodanese-like protein [Dichomitus squalens]TBU64855.1 Rhodanese-like protein [Dichomitus squalens]
MLRAALTRSAVRVASHVRPPTPSTRIALQHIRCESSNASDERRKRLEAADNLRRDWDAKVITYEELKPKTTQPSPDKYLIDVREPDEVLQGSIPSAVNLPLSQLATALHLPPEQFKEKYGFEKPRPNQEVTFYCRSGVRSTSASDVAKRNGYTNILNYKGSWLEWTEREGTKPAA